jgi:hypothetical protein
MWIDKNALLGLFPKLHDIPACGEGMELAKQFLESCGDAIAQIEEEDEVALRFRFVSCWNAFARHRYKCDVCNERQGRQF